MKRYLPIRIFSIKFGYGWWWGRYFYFCGRKSTGFAIMPMWTHYKNCTYENGMNISDGRIHSWTQERQREKYGN